MFNRKVFKEQTLSRNMERDFTSEYGRLLKSTIRGINIRTFFLGYGSRKLGEYIDSQKQERWELWDSAYDGGQDFMTRKNLDLGVKLFGLEVIVEMNQPYRLGFD